MFEHIRKRLAVVSIGVWITTIALAAVGGRYLWVLAERPAHLKEIVHAYGSVSLFKYMPQPSPSGEWVTYVKTGDDGFELGLANVATGQTKTLRKESGVGEWGSDCDFRAWPWSPDSARFACSQKNEVFLGNPQTGEIEADMEVPATVTALVWLGTNTFLCVGGTSTNSRFYWFQKQMDGKWHRESELKLSSSAGTYPDQTAAAAYDGSANTKWFNSSQSATGWLECEFENIASPAISNYFLASANDEPGRDPKDWQLQASDDGLEWANLDTRTNEIFATRGQRKSYSFANTHAYSHYRLNITANRNGKPGLQLSEFQLGVSNLFDRVTDEGLEAKMLQGASSHCALGSDTVLWAQNNCIWSLNKKSAIPALLLDLRATELSNGKLRRFSYSELTGRFLLECLDSTLWSIGLGEPVTQLQRLPSNLNVENAVWLNEKSATRSGWVGREKGVHNLAGSLAASPETVQVLLHVDVGLVTVAPGSEKVFFIGTISNEPAYGLYQYDPASKRLSCVVPGAAISSPWAREIDPVATTLKTASGKNLRCQVYKPAGFSYREEGKYPLVIGDTFFGSIVNGAHGRLWIPALVANGAYVVFVSRSSWNNGIKDWGDDVSALYDKMLENPQIDKNRVYLFAASEETTYTSELLTSSPRKWAGAILLNPLQLPDLSKLRHSQHAPRILISTGELEGRGDEFKRYQTEALKFGSLVNLFIASGEGHHFVGNRAQQQRTTAIAGFIFDE